MVVLHTMPTGIEILSGLACYSCTGSAYFFFRLYFFLLSSILVAFRVDRVCFLMAFKRSFFIHHFSRLLMLHRRSQMAPLAHHQAYTQGSTPTTKTYACRYSYMK